VSYWALGVVYDALNGVLEFATIRRRGGSSSESVGGTLIKGGE